MQYLQQTQMHPYAYLLANVPPLGVSRPIVLAGWQQIKAWIGELVQVDVTLISSQTHRYQWIWINLAPLEVMQ